MSARRSDWTRRDLLRALCASSVGAAAPGWLSACRPRQQAVPPAIAVGEDVCDWCRMVIDDPRLVAALAPAEGRALRFGEPGCLLAWLAERPAATGEAFVAAQEDSGWMAASSARFGRGLIRTPMRFDLAAWRAEPVDAPERLTWTQLLAEGGPGVRRS